MFYDLTRIDLVLAGVEGRKKKKGGENTCRLSVKLLTAFTSGVERLAVPEEVTSAWGLEASAKRFG